MATPAKVLIRLCDEILDAPGGVQGWQRLMVQSMRQTLRDGAKLPAAQLATLNEIHRSVTK